MAQLGWNVRDGSRAGWQLALVVGWESNLDGGCPGVATCRLSAWLGPLTMGSRKWKLPVVLEPSPGAGVVSLLLVTITEGSPGEPNSVGEWQKESIIGVQTSYECMMRDTSKTGMGQRQPNGQIQPSARFYK